MPEYLAPGVYVEEIDTGNKPIEGVSTSTAGMIGVTERGPLNVPMLVTSFGEYRRIFGDHLDIELFTHPTGRVHSYFSHAVEGFFTNGGKRAWIVRTAPRDAARATRLLFYRDLTVATLEETVLLRAAEQNTGTMINQPLLYVLSANDLVAGEIVRIGDGSRAEYRTVAAVGTAATHVSLDSPLDTPHAAGTTVQEITPTPDTFTVPPVLMGATFQLNTAVNSTSTQILIDPGTVPAEFAALSGLTSGDRVLLQVGTLPNVENVVATFDQVTLGGQVQMTLPTPNGLTTNYAAMAPVELLAIYYTTADFALTVATNAGATDITVGAGTTASDLVALSNLPNGTQLILQVETTVGTPGNEYVVATITSATATEVQMTLAQPLQSNHVIGDDVTILRAPTAGQALAMASNRGDSIIYLNTLAGGYATPGQLIVIDTGANQEIRRIGQLSTLPLVVRPYELYPGGSRVEGVTLADDTRMITLATTSTATLDSVTDVAPGMVLRFGTDRVTVSSVDSGTNEVAFVPSLGAAPAGNVAVQSLLLTAAAAPGSIVISIDNRIGLDVGDILRIGTAPNHEFAVIREVIQPRNVPPDAGAIILRAPLGRDHANGAQVQWQRSPVVDPSRSPTSVALGASTNATGVLVVDGSSYTAADIVRVTTPSGNAYYHQLAAAPAAESPREITLNRALERSHGAGVAVVERSALIQVRALDPGAWGNRVLVSCAEEQDGLLARAGVTAATQSPGPGLPSTLRLTTLTGVGPGTVLELRDPTNATQIDALLKVRQVDRAAGNLVILDPPGLQPAHLAAHTAAQAAGLSLVARSREFRLEALLEASPNPAIPSRSEDILDREVFRHLSMDQRHSRYFERIVGSTWTDGNPNDDLGGVNLGRPLRISDRRSEGASSYIRVHDLATTDAARESLRLGPEALIDTLPSGLTRPARHRLGEGEDAAVLGNDSVATMSDAMYLGIDDRQPERRTGIFALKNRDTISIVAVPGQTTAAVQQALIDHCEEQRYRFAVLDAQGPSLDTLADVQNQRQQFDTKYAALYYPWLTIPDPFPDTLNEIAQFPIPPSGHILGIYARSDIERGVHKAPANEVVRGIVGLARYLNKGEHDILNAYPVNIDVIRDFRPNNRGIRVWGARCITSDSDYKYVNVRRLLIFLEDSIDRGLQWVVFEPNAPDLWARVRRAIINFLTIVWRNGALEGTTVEQAFFVKCDRTTMTQTDIDSGRLICVIGVAPVKPAEFVIIRIGLWTAEANS